jgi:hypothetical protein
VLHQEIVGFDDRRSGIFSEEKRLRCGRIAPFCVRPCFVPRSSIDFQGEATDKKENQIARFSDRQHEQTKSRVYPKNKKV